jgi:hypothetical protein
LRQPVLRKCGLAGSNVKEEERRRNTLAFAGFAFFDTTLPHPQALLHGDYTLLHFASLIYTIKRFLRIKYKKNIYY